MGKQVAVISAGSSGLARLRAFQSTRTGRAECGGLWNHTGRTGPEFAACSLEEQFGKQTAPFRPREVLFGDLDYPGFDVDSANAAFLQWKNHRKQNNMTFRNNRYRSVTTATMAPIHHSPWIDAMDDSMKNSLRNE